MLRRCTRTMVPILALAALLGGGSAAQAIQIVLDYQFDTTNNFFSTQQRKDALQAAANFYNNSFSDQLSAITPGGGNTWHGDFFDPETGLDRSVTNLTITTNQVIIYAGGQSLGGPAGQGGPGSYGATGTQTFLNTVVARGQLGALNATPTDFGPWGGSITFDTATTWHFDHNTLPAAGEIDFYSVALHELAHALGFGSADSWGVLINGTNGTFTGAHAQAAYGGPVPLSDSGHWLQGTTNFILGTSTPQEVAMDPAITVGTRKLVTTLDMAGLQDVGWNLLPQTLTWSGAANHTWNFTAANTNWNVPGAPGAPGVAYGDGNIIILDDTGANTTINLTTSVLPISLMVSNNVKAYTISGGGSINGAASLVKNGTNSLTISTSNGFTGGSTFNAGVTTVNNTNALGSGAVVTANAGTELHFGSTVNIGALAVGTNTTVFADTNGGHAIVTTGLTLAGSSSNTPAGTVQLHDNDLIVKSGGGNLLAVRAAIKAARTGGTWAGQGITTDLNGTNAGPGAGKTKTLAYARGNDTNLAISSLDGQAIGASDAVVKYTYVGDANLDGSVDGLDIAKWATNFTGALGLGATADPAKVWTQGDWNFDGSVDGLDAAIWATNFTGALGGGGLSGMVVDVGPGAGANPGAVAMLEGMGITVVPEPASLVLLVLGGATWLRRRSRG